MRIFTVKRIPRVLGADHSDGEATAPGADSHHAGRRGAHDPDALPAHLLARQGPGHPGLGEGRPPILLVHLRPRSRGVHPTSATHSKRVRVEVGEKVRKRPDGSKSVSGLAFYLIESFQCLVLGAGKKAAWSIYSSQC